MTMLEIFFWLLFAHALADFPFQGSYIAAAKNGAQPVPDTPWWYIMGVHSLIHAGMVMMITGMWFLAVAEFVCHYIIDDMKCRGRFGYLTDQVLHIECKLAWAIVATVMV